MAFRVEGATEASLTSDVFPACLFQHSWRGLAGLSPSHQPLVREFAGAGCSRAGERGREGEGGLPGQRGGLQRGSIEGSKHPEAG